MISALLYFLPELCAESVPRVESKPIEGKVFVGRSDEDRLIESTVIILEGFHAKAELLGNKVVKSNLALMLLPLRPPRLIPEKFVHDFVLADIDVFISSWIHSR